MKMFENDLLVLALLIVNLLVGFGLSYFIANRRYEKYKEEITELDDSLKKKTGDLTTAQTNIKNLNTTTETQISELEKRVQEGLMLIEKFKGDMIKAVEQIQSLESEIEEKNSTIDELKTEINILENSIISTTTRAEEAEKRVQELMEVSQTLDQKIEAQKSRMLAMQDDLAHLSGIGPKVSSILRTAGVNTFAKLANTDLTRINEILEAANPSLLRLTDPTTWSKQAQLAAKGEWEELKRYQNQIKSARA